MTIQEAKDYLTGIEPQQRDMIILNKATWDDFKASMLVFLDNPGVDPKYKAALESIDNITDEIVG